jgi:20S proteasome alpha/beta subunit
MTIAAGFRCEDGLLLCADTEHTGWAEKSHHSKVDQFEVPGGKVCFALAGASTLARSAIQKCKRQLQANASTDLVADIEGILDAEYRRNVLGHPNHAAMDYSLLVGLWTEADGPRLFFTTATAMTEVKDFHCLGIGAELANFLIRPMAFGVTLKVGTVLAAYTLATVKDNIAGCGGASIYLLMKKDGAIGLRSSEFDSGLTAQVEKYARTFDFLMRRALIWMADLQVKDEYFELNIETLVLQPLRQKHTEWIKAYKAQEQQFANVNAHLSEQQVVQMFEEISMGFVPST